MIDSQRDDYYNFYHRELIYAKGGSTALAGSGMALRYNLFKEFLLSNEVSGKGSIKVVAGEDKILQNQLCFANHIVAYAAEAKVQDKKVANGKQVERQRGRWFLAYLQNLKGSISLLFWGLLTWSRNKILTGFMGVFPPISWIYLLSAIALCLDVFFAKTLLPLLILSILTFLITYFIGVKKENKLLKINGLIISYVLFFFHLIGGLLFISKAKRDFLVTKHN